METSVNNKCKSFTSLEQSKILAKILPLESADCFWDYDDLQKYHRISWFEEGYDKDSQLRTNENNVCAWSLTELLEVLPLPQLSEDKLGSGKVGWMVSAYPYGCRYDSNWHDNPVDACVEMVLKLHELKCCDYDYL